MPRKKMLVISLILTIGLFVLNASAQTSNGSGKANPGKPTTPSNLAPETIESRVEKYLRNAYAWGPAFQVKVGPIKPSPIPEILEVPISITMQGQSNTAVVYVNKEGNFLFRGEISDMSIDPLADVRSKLSVGNSPSMGPENAKITLIEFADFECPSCRQLDHILRNIMAEHPDYRLVYKSFPLTDIHPWAMTAAIAGQCAYQQNASAFWKIHNAIFDAQDVISPENVWDKMIDLGTQLGLNIDTYRSCMSNPETEHVVEQTIIEGSSLNITGTPTTFINGRRVVGPDESLIDQYTQFEHVILNII